MKDIETKIIEVKETIIVTSIYSNGTLCDSLTFRSDKENINISITNHTNIKLDYLYQTQALLNLLLEYKKRNPDKFEEC